MADGLRLKLAEIQTAVRATEHRLKMLTADRATVTKALRLFEVQDPREIGAISIGVPSGAFARMILDVIRQAGDSLSARQITEALAVRSAKPLDPRQFDTLLARVRNALLRLSEQLDGELRDRTTFWRVKS